MNCMDLLEELTRHTAVSGYEKGITDAIGKHLGEGCDNVKTDRFYNVIGLKKGIGDGPRIMVTAHMDEIGLMVSKIDKNGFVFFSKVGGIDSKLLLAQEVVIHGRKDIFGIIGAKPPHLLKPDEAKKAVKGEDLAIDTGLSEERLREYVSIGDLITFRSASSVLKNNRFSSKTVDNRAGVVALVECMRELVNIKHRSELYFAATVQEEFDLTGAYVASYNLEPDIAIVIDACHGDMPDSSKEDTFALGKGPAIGVGPLLNKKLTNRLIETAKEEGIPYQIDVEPRDTGTEAWATQISKSGIPTVLLSIPVRYMHSPVETVQIDDIRNTARLAARFIGGLDKGWEAVRCF